MLSGRDDPTVGTERFIVAALQEFTSVLEEELASKKAKSTLEEPKTLDQVAPSYQKLIVISNLSAIRHVLKGTVDLQSIDDLEVKVTKAFIEEQVKIILPWVLQDLQNKQSIVYRLLRELSEVDRQICEIDSSLTRPLLTLLVAALLEGLSQLVIGKGRQAHLDGLVLKSVLASLISDHSSVHLERFLANNQPLENENGLEDGGQSAIDAFKRKNPILVSIFTY